MGDLLSTNGLFCRSGAFLQMTLQGPDTEWRVSGVAPVQLHFSGMSSATAAVDSTKLGGH
jgi:hypothetical protein